VAALLQRLRNKHYSIPTGHSARHSEYVPFTEIIGARFIVFRVRCLSDMTLCNDYVSRVERTFAMGLKGGLGLFSKYGDKLCVRSVHFDGYKQYDRNLNLPRILNKIGVPPNGVSFASDVALDSRDSDHREPDSQSYDDCQLQQLTDVLVSGFRTVLAEAKHASQLEICKPLAELAKTWDRGPKGYSNSRWFKGICISEGFIEDGQWQFARIENRPESNQPTLF